MMTKVTQNLVENEVSSHSSIAQLGKLISRSQRLTAGLERHIADLLNFNLWFIEFMHLLT